MASAHHTRRRPSRAPRAAAAIALLAVASCASNSNDAASTTTDPVGPAPTKAAFVVPDSRIAAVEEAGLSIAKPDYAEQPDGVAWPTEEWPTGELSGGVDANKVDAIVKKSFADDGSGDKIDAILVVQGGRLVVEEYNGWDPEVAHNSWSMAKSINSALVGILVGQGELDIWKPVDAPEWKGDDPRAKITLDDLLRMSSGLEWEESYSDAGADVIKSLGSDLDRAHYAANKPLVHEPGTFWAYSTGTANLISRSVAQQVGYGEQLTGWADDELFAPLGITSVEHMLDPNGLISGGSWMNMTPRDFARFGLLYARDGVWDGRRILPAGWVDYSRMATPTMDEGRYGAQWWLDPERPDLFYANGFDGQSIGVAPAKDLVVVVLSKAPNGRNEQVYNDLYDAFGVSSRVTPVQPPGSR